jgi:hypothetical protein
MLPFLIDRFESFLSTRLDCASADEPGSKQASKRPKNPCDASRTRRPRGRAAGVAPLSVCQFIVQSHGPASSANMHCVRYVVEITANRSVLRLSPIPFG